MDDFSCTAKSNYFKVSNLARLEEMVKASYGVVLYDGEFNYGFSIVDCNHDYKILFTDYGVFDFCEELQKILLDDQVCVIHEVQHDRSFYVQSYAKIITRKSITTLDFKDYIKKEMSKNYTVLNSHNYNIAFY